MRSKRSRTGRHTRRGRWRGRVDKGGRRDKGGREESVLGRLILSKWQLGLVRATLVMVLVCSV